MEIFANGGNTIFFFLQVFDDHSTSFVDTGNSLDCTRSPPEGKQIFVPHSNTSMYTTPDYPLMIWNNFIGMCCGNKRTLK